MTCEEMEKVRVPSTEAMKEGDTLIVDNKEGCLQHFVIFKVVGTHHVLVKPQQCRCKKGDSNG